jgi:hypothetical protein
LNFRPDTRPGLVFDRPTARRYNLERKHHELNESSRQLPIHELEAQKREEALSTTTLSPSNKGFNLMLKMGYKSGETLGKSNDYVEPEAKRRMLEPIKVVLKSDRQGLGQEEARKRKIDEVEELRKKFKAKRLVSDENLTTEYLNRKKTSFQLRKLRHNLHKCQRVCFQLDSAKKVN